MTLLEKIINLIVKQEIRISDHGYDELANDDLTAREVVPGALDAIIVADYPDYCKGCICSGLVEG
jgi:hypothetical protein